jgi:hypothetical protein
MESAGCANVRTKLHKGTKHSTLEFHDQILDPLELENTNGLLDAGFPGDEVENIKDFFAWYEKLSRK